MRTDSKMTASELADFPSDIHPTMKAASEMWADAYFVMTVADRALFCGPPGTGKTRLTRKYNLDRPLEITSLTPETCWPEIRGHYGMSEKGMVYIDGPGVRAWINGSRWCIDEIDQAGGDTVPGLHMLLDDRNVASLTLPTGETIHPAEGFQCFATTNAIVGALPEALNDRFVIQRTITHPDPRMLLSLPIKIRVAAAYSLYSTVSDPTLRGLTTRKWIAMGDLMDRKGLDLKSAVTAIVGPRNAKAATMAIEVAAAKLSVQAAALDASLAPQPTV